MKIEFRIWRYCCYSSAILAGLAVFVFIFGMFGLDFGSCERFVSFISCFFLFFFGFSVMIVLILENTGFLTFVYEETDKETWLYKIQQRINRLIQDR